MSKKHVYEGKEIDVEWDGKLCIHVAECGHAKGDLFVRGRDPWCDPDTSSTEEVREVVERCPTGALSYRDKEGVEESAPAENTATVSNNGPLYMSGDLEIEGADEDSSGLRYRAALCRCGASKNKPFCDNNHLEAGFQDSGSVGEKGPGLSDSGGKLGVKALPNGPLIASGNLTIRAASGRVAWEGTTAALCRCGHSKNKPFCDGSHKHVGFRSD